MNKVVSLPRAPAYVDSTLPATQEVGLRNEVTTWQIHTVYRRYGKTYRYDVRIDAKEIHFSPYSWIASWLTTLQESSLSSGGFVHSDAQRLAIAIRRFGRNPLAPALSRIPASRLSLEDVHDIFVALEDSLDEDEDLAARKEPSSVFRKLFFQYAPLIGLAPRITSRSVAFRTRFPVIRKRKSLLGDFSDTQPPLGATEFTNHSDLKAKLKVRAENALSEVQSALTAEIKCGARLRAFLLKCAELPIDIDLITCCQRLLSSRNNRKKDYSWVLGDIEQYIGAVIICVRANGMQFKNHGPRHGFLFSDEVRSYLLKIMGWNGRKQDVFYALEFGLMDEICSAVTLLQSIAGWNVQVAVDLEYSQISEDAEDLVIVGYKGKTDSNTPPLMLGPEDLDARRAVELLQWNHHQMIDLGYKEQFDGRLCRIAKARREDGIPALPHFVNKFRARYRIPNFSLSIMRRQRIFIEGLTSPENARLLAGHVSLSTTSIYLDTEVAYRMNSSISLKMKRRMESELLYAIGIERDRPTWPLMLTPVGDGSSCIDPTNPPPGQISDSGLCRGTGCHANEGCSNNRLVIDRSRIQEALETRNMYILSWRKIHARNPPLFVLHHIPKIIFNSALLNLIESGPYAYLLRDIENEN